MLPGHGGEILYWQQGTIIVGTRKSGGRAGAKDGRNRPLRSRFVGVSTPTFSCPGRADHNGSGWCSAYRPTVVRYLPRCWRSAVTGIRKSHWPQAVVHHFRSIRCGRPDEPGAARAGAVEDQGAISKKRHLRCHLFARGQLPRCAKNDSYQAISVV